MNNVLAEETDAKTGIHIAVYREVEIAGRLHPHAIVLSRSAAFDQFEGGADPWGDLLRQKDWRIGGMVKFALRRLRDMMKRGEG